MVRSAAMRHGRVYNLETGRVTVHFVSNPAADGAPVQVELVVLPLDGAEQRFTVHVGDRFPVGSATWALAGVDGAGSYEYVVRIARVDG